LAFQVSNLKHNNAVNPMRNYPNVKLSNILCVCIMRTAYSKRSTTM
jgi:hypothetical protein